MPTQQAVPQARVNVKIVVDVPSALLTAGVQSIVVAFIPVGEVVPPAIAPLTIDVATGSADCAAAGGKVGCGGTLGVPLGQQNFTVTLFSGAAGTGSQLGVKSFTATITGAGQTVDVSNASGVIAVVSSLRLVIAPTTILSGVASNFTVAVNAFDSLGRLITTPYNVPVTVVAPPTASPGLPPILNGPSPGPDGMVSLIASGPGQIFSFAYTGTQVGLPAAFTFSASALDVAPVSTQLTVFVADAAPTSTPSPTPTPAPTVAPIATPMPGAVNIQPDALFFVAPGQPAQTFVASAPGFATFTAVSSDPAVATVTGSGATFAVTPVGAGATIITVTDAAGGTGSVNAYVTNTTIIISSRRRRQ